MATHVSDLLLATTVRVQLYVSNLADSSVQANGASVPTEITMKCGWVNDTRALRPKVEDIIGNAWGLMQTYGGYAAIVLAIIIAVLGKFAFGRRLTGLFLWIVIGLLVIGVAIQIVQSTIGTGCA